MSNTVPAAHVTAGTRILVDGDSFSTTVVEVRTQADGSLAVVCEAGTVFCAADAELTFVRPLANARAEGIFVASGLPDTLRSAVSAEASFLMNVGAAGRFSDAVDQACRWAKQGVFTGKLAQGLAAAAVA